MLSEDSDYKDKVYSNLIRVYLEDLLPRDHIMFLEDMRETIKPKVCYDIGSCVMHWTRHAERIWPETKVILFDAFAPVEYIYNNNNKKRDYFIGLLSDQDNKEIKFYQNDFFFGGNSYYKEKALTTEVFPEEKYIIKKTNKLDTIVKERNYPYPDLIKIDVQGAELDILKGANLVLENAKYLIVELQDVEYNLGAPLNNVTIDYLKSIGWECLARKFSDNGPDGDYFFINTKLIKTNINP